MSDFKRLLIVDDSEIDRTVLKNILNADFDVIEADNGYSGLKIILGGKPHLDAVLLDISMPVLDGFNVLELMKENGVKNLPVIFITAEATKSNVEKAIMHKAMGFISKPFEPKLVSEKLRAMFDIVKTDEKVVIPSHVLSDNDIAETNTYISKLTGIYKEYLKNNDRDDEHYTRVSAVTSILLSEYSTSDYSSNDKEKSELDNAHIKIISKAAYFFDIGTMAVPGDILAKKNRTESENAVFESHTVIGANIVWLNHSPSCNYFVKTCGDMCMHHHERNDGRGYPHGLNGSDNTFYTQICALAHKFDTMFSKRPAINEHQFDFVISEMELDQGRFSTMLLSLLKDCRFAILTYYKKYNNENKKKK